MSNRMGGHYRFWQRGGGYDRNVTEPRTVWAEIDYLHANPVRYLHANPVRRRLCRRPEDWVWSSAREILTGQPGLIPLDKSSMPLTDRG